VKRFIGLAVICALGVRAEPGRTSTDQLPAANEGRLRTTVDGERVDIPLAHTDVRIRIDGHLADATVTQTFRNPYDDKINAVYLFPLPTGAAVNQMSIKTGVTTIEGTIHRRAEAKRIYHRARRKGKVAALLEQERPNLFTQSVANIEPGAEIEVTLRYVQSLDYDDGGYELVFPMVAGPRYGGEQAVQSQVLPPGQRSSHDISLSAEIDAGVPLTAIESPSHRVELTRDDGGRRATVSIADDDTIPNKDFVLRYRVAGDAPELAVLAHRDGGDGSFFLVAQPPAAADDDDVAPRELVFVLDTSSSMSGAPLDKAKQVVRDVLAGMRADDTFQIVRFDDGASALGPAPIANKPRNLRYVYDWLDALDAAGGTEMMGGLEAALEVPHDPLRLRLVVFLTDGYIGNEDEILKLVADRMGDSRLFSFGVGSSVNRYLLEEMATLGRGDAHFVQPDEDTAEVVGRFARRIDRAVLTDIRVDWGELAVTDVVPEAIPDLFVGKPLVVSGHYVRPGATTVMVHGVRAGRDVSFEVPVTLPERRERPAVATVWARRRIAELSRDLLRKADEALEQQIVDLALAHRMMTRYTAFVAVDSSRVTDGGDARTVKVPVEVPARVRRIERTSAGVSGGIMGTMIGSGGGGYGYGVIGTGNYGAAVGRGGSGDSAGASFGQPKADVARPTVRIGAATATGSLDKSIIRRYIRKKLSAVRYCYEKQLMQHPDLDGTVTVKMTINGDGLVIAAAASGMGNQAVEQCVAGAMRSIQFPANSDGGFVQISYPFIFRRAGDE